MAAAYGDGRERRRLAAAAPRRPRRLARGAPGVARRGSSRRASRAQVLSDAAGRRHRGNRPGGAACPATRWPARPGPRRSRIRAAATRRRSYVASFVGIVPATNPRLVILRHGRRAARRDLGRRRRRAGVPADRRLRPPVPRGSAGRPRDAAASAAAGRVARLARGLSGARTHRRNACPRARSSGTRRRDRRPRLRHPRGHAGRALLLRARRARRRARLRRRAIDARRRRARRRAPARPRRAAARRRGLAARDGGRGAPRSSAIPPTSSRSPPSRGRTARRRRRSCCTRSSGARAAGPACWGRSSAASAARRRPAIRTTPEAIDLQRAFREMLDAGNRSARDGGDLARLRQLGRLDGVRFAVARVHEPDAGPPRLPRDDGDATSRRSAGSSSTDARRPRSTSATPWGRKLAEDRPRRAHLRLRRRRGAPPRRARRHRPQAAGRFNVENVLARAAPARVCSGSTTTRSRAGSRRSTGVPGRFEAVDEGQPFTVARRLRAHAGLARERARRRRASLDAGRVICVFGCGGDRDREKRPLMGQIAAELADVADRHLRQPAQRGPRRDHRRDRRRRRRRRSRSIRTAAPRSRARSRSPSRATSS